MREVIYKPTNTGDGVIVQYTDSFILDKGMKISVPNQYIAVVFDNEKISFRVEPCVGKVIFKEYGKNFLGHTMKIAFIHVTAIPEMPWGFGNIQVNNERLKEAYRVGANGTFQIKITDFTKLMSAFSGDGEITVDDVKEKVLSLIKTIGIELVGACFANTDVSVFEISSLVGIIREDLFEKLSKESKLADMGIKIANLTVAGVHVNEEDLELIRDRINGSEDTKSDDNDDSDDDGETVKLREDIQKFQTEILKKMSEEIAAAEARSKDASERKITEQIENNRRATVSTVMQYINAQLDEFGKSLSSELDEKMLNEANDRLINDLYRKISALKSKLDMLNVRRSNYSACFNILDIIYANASEILTASQFSMEEASKAKVLLNIGKLKAVVNEPDKAIAILKVMDKDIQAISEKVKSMDEKVFGLDTKQTSVTDSALAYKEELMRKKREREFNGENLDELERGKTTSTKKVGEDK